MWRRWRLRLYRRNSYCRWMPKMELFGAAGSRPLLRGPASLSLSASHSLSALDAARHDAAARGRLHCDDLRSLRRLARVTRTQHPPPPGGARLDRDGV